MCPPRGHTTPLFIFHPADTGSPLSVRGNTSTSSILPGTHQGCPPRGHTTSFHLPPRGLRIHSPVVRCADTRSAPPVSGKTSNVSAARTHNPPFHLPPRGHRIPSVCPRQHVYQLHPSGNASGVSAARTHNLISSSAARTQDPLPRCPLRGHAICSTCQRQDIKCVRRADTQPPFHLPPRGLRIHSPVVRRADTRSAPPVSGKTPNVSAARTHATTEQVSGPQNLSEGASISVVARLKHCERAKQFPR